MLVSCPVTQNALRVSEALSKAFILHSQSLKEGPSGRDTPLASVARPARDATGPADWVRTLSRTATQGKPFATHRSGMVGPG